jgi:hypothetical protein
MNQTRLETDERKPFVETGLKIGKTTVPQQHNEVILAFPSSDSTARSSVKAKATLVSVSIGVV